LFDDSTARNLESTSETSLKTMTPAHDNHTGGSAVVDAPELAQPSSAEANSAPDATQHDATEHVATHSLEASHHDEPAHEDHATSHDTSSESSSDSSSESSNQENASAGSDDFAAALQSFETETEDAVGEDHVIKGTVIKLTATHVVVDIGAKSEGMAPIAEILDHEGNPRFKAGDEIDVMRDKGETEEGYVNLSHLKAQRLRSWDEIERAFNEKKPIKGVVVERIKGGLTIDINGARAFLPGSQVDLRPIRNLDGMKGQTMEVAIIKLNK
jgi:small subunit ribosomal protein S1